MQPTPTTTSPEMKVPVCFSWSGRTRDRVFQTLYAGVVDVMVKGAQTKVSISLPLEDIQDGETKTLPFTCRRHEGTLAVKVTHPDLLNLKIEQVREMSLTVGIFEPGRPIGPVILHKDGTREQQQTTRRSDREISLELPKTIEPGQQYRLVVYSNDLIPVARLEKLVKPSSSDAVK